jgi:hypothetical protein
VSNSIRNFFRKHFSKEPPSESEILNKGLRIALRLDGSGNKSFQQNLLKKYKFLNPEQLQHYEAICCTIEGDASNFMLDTVGKRAGALQTTKDTDLKEMLAQFVREKNSWVNDDNLSWLYHRGMYLIWHEGLLKSVK